MKRGEDLRRISRRGFDRSLDVFPRLWRKPMAKSLDGPALVRTGTGNVIGASANFRYTYIAIGEVEAWAINYSLLSSTKRNGWDFGNCWRAFFFSTRRVAPSVTNTVFVKSVSTRNML